ncbi:aminodeoxychorismate lyase [Neobacillus jeddahensis]|uniref:aminodeoxychorismate lyase n=1 Tax=Neobacillus jeddahensis TaxID=1461580 RepID=UPI00058B1F91|nr:aminodeoxychorismate lyase [Neobacillus jeddahensis]
MFVYQNGEFINKDAARISPFDHGFLYGMGVFETFRVYEGHPFLLDDHLERINHSLDTLMIMHTFDRNEINLILQDLLQINQLKNAYIRLNVSAGVGEVGLSVAPYDQPGVMIFSKPLPPGGELLEKRAVLLNLKRNSPEGDERLKSHHFMNNMLAKREIGHADDVEGIFLTVDGYVAEGIVSNVFWVKGDVLYTPSLQTGILNGITRQFVIQLGRKNNLQIDEGLYTPEQLMEADEIFITNSIQEIVPIKSFGEREFPGRKGRLVYLLHQDYRYYCHHLWSRNNIS